MYFIVCVFILLQGSETHTFSCNRWLARDEEDGAIARELVADKVIQEFTRKDGSIRKKEIDRRDTLICKIFCNGII